MLKERRINLHKSKNRNRLYQRVTYVYVCDECSIEFERRRLDHRLMHFHSKECYQISMKFGRAREYVIASMTDEVLDKKRQTMLSRYGVATTLSLPGIQEKIRDICHRKFGGNSSMADPAIRAKKEQTFLKLYGTKVPIAYCENVISKSIATQVERYGDIFTRTQAYLDVYRSSSLERWGFEHPMQSNDVKSKIDFQTSWAKQHETKKRNGTYSSSKIEQQFGDLLACTFPDIERQVIVNGWSIDFYIKSTNTYVQFDGVYWHGLDRSLDEIKKHLNVRDVTIQKEFERDRLQDIWFAQQNMRLIRITDKEFKQNPTKALQKVLCF